jgi:anti-sigma factor RsiW
VLLDARHCPVDVEEAAEAYSIGTLQPADAAAFEEHFLICPRCACAVEDADKYVRAIKTAARRLRSSVGRASGAV